MRVIAGEFRGRPLEAPKGRDTRPTTDRVRESLMSMIFSARGGFDGACVLDAFAGSGALGIEALSRGASDVCFLEQDSKAAAIVKRNLETLGAHTTGARVLVTDSYKAAGKLMGSAFDLVFLDPPYAQEPRKVLGFIADLCSAGVLTEDALVSYEYDTKNCECVDKAAQSAALVSLKRRTFGDTTIEVFRLS